MIQVLNTYIATVILHRAFLVSINMEQPQHSLLWKPDLSMDFSDGSKLDSFHLRDIFCGQLQCVSNKKNPVHVQYGSVYKEIFVNGNKCRFVFQKVICSCGF